MHAVVSTVRVQDAAVARAAVTDPGLGLVPRAPGFVSAYWLEPVGGIGMPVIVFRAREHWHPPGGGRVDPPPPGHLPRRA